MVQEAVQEAVSTLVNKLTGATDHSDGVAILQRDETQGFVGTKEHLHGPCARPSYAGNDFPYPASLGPLTAQPVPSILQTCCFAADMQLKVVQPLALQSPLTHLHESMEICWLETEK